jgi:hypothetical protein
LGIREGSSVVVHMDEKYSSMIASATELGAVYIHDLSGESNLNIYIDKRKFVVFFL